MAFKAKTVAAPPPPPDPADLQNRSDSERRRRLGRGGRQSTLLTRMAETAAGLEPSATLTGNPG